MILSGCFFIFFRNVRVCVRVYLHQRGTPFFLLKSSYLKSRHLADFVVFVDCSYAFTYSIATATNITSNFVVWSSHLYCIFYPVKWKKKLLRAYKPIKRYLVPKWILPVRLLSQVPLHFFWAGWFFTLILSKLCVLLYSWLKDPLRSLQQETKYMIDIITSPVPFPLATRVFHKFP